MSESLQNKLRFKEYVGSLMQMEAPFKITFSKPRHQNKDVVNVYLKPAVIRNQIQYSLTFRHKHKDEVRNYVREQIPDVLDNLLGNMFLIATLFTQEEEWVLLQSKKGKASLNVRKNLSPVSIDTNHDRQKARPVPAVTGWLQALGLAAEDGRILDKSQDKYRQINKYIEIISSLLSGVADDRIFQIADMGSGKGYLTFALYDYLVNTKILRVKMTGYEIREELVGLCYNVAAKEGFVGLTFQQKSIEDANVAGVDMVIALHACDTATDMAIARAIRSGAAYIVVSPCCHKQIRSVMHHDNVLSPALKHGILEERQAEILTDGLRALIMEANGYRTQVFEFISNEHTSKNLMITGVKGTPDPAARIKADELMKFFGIEYHALDRQLTASDTQNKIQ